MGIKIKLVYVFSQKSRGGKFCFKIKKNPLLHLELLKHFYPRKVWQNQRKCQLKLTEYSGGNKSSHHKLAWRLGQNSNLFSAHRTLRLYPLWTSSYKIFMAINRDSFNANRINRRESTHPSRIPFAFLVNLG